MDIGTLKLAISNLPDNMLVGGSGHFGEYLEVYGIRKGKVSKGMSSVHGTEIFIIDIEQAGEEPE